MTSFEEAFAQAMRCNTFSLCEIFIYIYIQLFLCLILTNCSTCLDLICSSIEKDINPELIKQAHLHVKLSEQRQVALRSVTTALAVEDPSYLEKTVNEAKALGNTSYLHTYTYVIYP